MAELLTTKEILGALESVIKNAEKYICIFTFNIKIDENYLSRLRNASKRGVKIIIVFGVDNGDEKVLEAVLKMENCTVYFKEYLHAKFYYNEKELLVGSMNLSEASAKNNYELAVYFKGEDYSKAIEKVKREANEIISDATLWKEIKKSPRNLKPKTKENISYNTNVNETNSAEKYWEKKSKETNNSNSKSQGYCIRCKSTIKLDHLRPMCNICYSEWADWENDEYPEKYDHFTGEKSNGSTSKVMPILNINWKKYAKLTGN